MTHAFFGLLWCVYFWVSKWQYCLVCRSQFVFAFVLIWPVIIILKDSQDWILLHQPLIQMNLNYMSVYLLNSTSKVFCKWTVKSFYYVLLSYQCARVSETNLFLFMALFHLYSDQFELWTATQTQTTTKPLFNQVLIKCLRIYSFNAPQNSCNKLQ